MQTPLAAHTARAIHEHLLAFQDFFVLLHPFRELRALPLQLQHIDTYIPHETSHTYIHTIQRELFI